jgi:signal transduction histidine kinase
VVPQSPQMRIFIYLVFAALSLAWAIGGELTSVHYDFGGSHPLEFLSGLSFLWVGLYALWKRPRNVVGLLLFIYGFLWFLPFWLTWAPPAVDASLTVVASAAAALLAHLALVFPSGHIDTAFGRWTVYLAYAWSLGISFAVEAANGRLVWESLGFDCDEIYCRPTLGFWQSIEARSATGTIANIGNLVVLAITLLAFSQRWQRSTPVQRRELRPVWIPLVLIAGTSVAISIAGLLGASESTLLALRDLRSLVQIVGPVIIVLGLLRAGSAASGVSDFVRDIRNTSNRGDLQAALARALEDPTLSIRFPDGSPRWDSELPEATHEPANSANGRGQSKIALVTDSEGRTVAAIVHDAGLDPSAVAGAVAVVSIAIENDALHAEVLAQLAEVEASRARIVEAADAERRRVERNLHDGAQQRLLTLAMALRAARRQVGPSDGAAVALDEASDQLRLAIDELRELARGIHPAILTDSGIGPAVRALADRSPVPVTRLDLTPGRFPAPIESTVYFVVAEALANVAKHAGASSVTIAVRSEGDSIEVVVADDGVGGASTTRAGGSGLRGLVDRVAAVGGTVDLDSPPGDGTRVRVRIPQGGQA